MYLLGIVLWLAKKDFYYEDLASRYFTAPVSCFWPSYCTFDKKFKFGSTSQNGLKLQSLCLISIQDKATKDVVSMLICSVEAKPTYFFNFTIRS